MWKRIKNKVTDNNHSLAITNRVYSTDGQESWPRISLSIYEGNSKDDFVIVCQHWDKRTGLTGYWKQIGIPKELAGELIEMIGEIL
jgi:hypothetical protein